MKKQIKDLKQEVGQSMVEYALLIGLIALVAIPAITLLAGETGTATCVQVSEGSSGFFMHEYQKNDDTGIKSVFDNITCVLGGWEKDNIISSVSIKVRGPSKNGIIPIASEIVPSNSDYTVDEVEWSWINANRIPQDSTFASNHKQKNDTNNENLKKLGRPSGEYYQQFHWDENIENTYLSKLKLTAKPGFEFPTNPSQGFISLTDPHKGAGMKDYHYEFISKNEAKVTIYYDRMPEFYNTNN